MRWLSSVQTGLLGKGHQDCQKGNKEIGTEYHEIKKGATYKDWDGNIINAI